MYIHKICCTLFVGLLHSIVMNIKFGKFYLNFRSL